MLSAAGARRWALRAAHAGSNPEARAFAAADESKEKMYELHLSDPKTFTVDKLAADYGLRYQRVMAILALKKARAPPRRLLALLPAAER